MVGLAAARLTRGSSGVYEAVGAKIREVFAGEVGGDAAYPVIQIERGNMPSGVWAALIPEHHGSFAGLDAITPPLAGPEGASRAMFLGYNAIGALLWSSLSWFRTTSVPGSS
jgi:hypothetical protein